MPMSERLGSDDETPASDDKQEPGDSEEPLLPYATSERVRSGA
jgi:hypothetical protein